MNENNVVYRKKKYHVVNTSLLNSDTYRNDSITNGNKFDFITKLH